MIDKQTKPRMINIVVDDLPNYLEILREQAKVDQQDEKKLSLTSDNHNLSTEEYYFEVLDGEPEISYSGVMTSGSGDSFISFVIPLSDELLIDILQYSIKKFNKLKVAMESLK